MSILSSKFGRMVAGRKGPRGNRNTLSRKQDRRLVMERMEPRTLLSANPLTTSAVYIGPTAPGSKSAATAAAPPVERRPTGLGVAGDYREVGQCLGRQSH
jgi:hypothetical protein